MKNKFINIISFIIGLLIIGFYIYWRLIKTRLPRMLIFVDNPGLLFLSLSLIILHTYLFFNLFYERNSNKYLSLLVNYIYFSLTIVFETFFHRFKNIKGLIKYVTLKFLHMRPYIKIILFLFDILPKLTLSLVFLTDIFIFHKFYYFYKCLGLLILPIFMRVLFFMMHYWASNLQSDILSDLTVRVKNKRILKNITDKSESNNIEFIYILNKNNKRIFASKHEYITNLFITIDIQNFYEEYKNLVKEKSIKIILGIMHLIYIFGWLNIFLNIVLRLL